MSYKHPVEFPVIDGVRLVPGLTKEILHYFKHLPIKADRDVFVVNYPKSGTTWISEIIWQIYNDGNTKYTSIFERVPYMEYWHLTHNVDSQRAIDNAFLNSPEPRVFKFHLPYHQVPMVDTDGAAPKYFYLIRNPKDVAVSWYYHYKGFKPFQFNHSWDEFFELFINDQTVYGSWFDHVLGWWSHRQDQPNILFLKFEDMKKNLTDAVQQIAKHLGKELSPDVIQRIVNQTKFSEMASNSKGRFYDNDSELGRLFRVQGGVEFMRKGDIGDWKNYFTEEQNKRFDELYVKRMAGSGLELNFDG